MGGLSKQGTLSSLLTPQELLGRYLNGSTAQEGLAMSCGTLGAIGGICPASAFRMALHDPVLNRTLEHRLLHRHVAGGGMRSSQ
ncbi:DUF2848 family protein [Pantoea sp. LMR881]|uniref:DUF2848 family protein n=1 Tax=Pantoea sp. LMR881 TaxID=3014336 RepID=UPI0022AF57F4|nr:DUF2848 family protein [Pantoea sp. LMR881]MCZ4060940.1 DUF2848 family protein [Pantoea sp. LMR881]